MTLVSLLLLIFPFLNLLTIATSYATICLLTQQCVSQAAKQHTYKEALKTISSESQSWLNSPFASFAKLSPVRGYRNSGIDLFVEATDFRTTKVTTFGPNTPIPSPLDPQTFVYELAAAGSFEIKPFVDMSKIPVLGGIAGLGQPITLNYRCAKAAEHVAGLDDDSPITTAYSGGSMTLNPPYVGNWNWKSPSNQTNVGSWNHPDIYEQIKAAGLKVLAQDVIIVHANNPYWTPTNLEVPDGASIWIDYRGDGEWIVSPTSGPCDAAGDYCQASPGIWDGMMLGKLGINGKSMAFGKALWNKNLTGNGKLFVGALDIFGMPMSVIDNQNNAHGEISNTILYDSLVKDGFPPEPAYEDNQGTMEVRIVIAK